MAEHSSRYDRYMNSKEWEKKRSELDDNKCVMCGRPNGLQKDGVTPILQVHHIHYQNLGNEPIEDLVSLCPTCHKRIHKYYARARNWSDKVR